MKYKIVSTKNVSRLADAAGGLLNRAQGMPGMGIVWGSTGYGKTTAAAWLATRVRGVYIRAITTTTPSSLLASILYELGEEKGGSCAAMVSRVVQCLVESGRPLFIDEAEKIVRSERLVETLRDIHDLATVPVVLIGEPGIERAIRARRQITGRMAEWVEFGPADVDDAALVAQSLAEVEIQSDLVEALHASSHGEIRQLVVGIAQVERYARAKGMTRIGQKDWPKGRPFSFKYTHTAGREQTAPRVEPPRPQLAVVGPESA